MIKNFIKDIKNSKGFSIVELLVVIVVIGILAAIVIVSYNGVQKSAQGVSLKAEVRKAMDQVTIAVLDSAGAPLTGFPSDVEVSDGNIIRLSKDPNSSYYCVDGYNSSAEQKFVSYDSKGKWSDGVCSYTQLGSSIGGTFPPAERSVWKSIPLSQFVRSGGIEAAIRFDPGSGELISSGSGAGTFRTPYIRTDGASSITIRYDIYATQPSPHYTPNSGSHNNSVYFAADMVTPAANSHPNQYTANGDTRSVALGQWVSTQSQFQMGPNVIYTRITINSSPTTYTSANRIKNFEYRLSP